MSGDKAHVIIVNQHFPPLPGGGSLRVDSIAMGLHALAEDGEPLAVSVLTGSIPDLPVRPYSVSPTLGQPVASDRPLLSRLIGEVLMGLRASWQLLWLRPQPDLLVISIPSYFMGLMVVAYARLRRVEYVVDLRDIYPEIYEEAGLLSRTSLAYRAALRLSRRMYLGAQLVVTATNGLKKRVEALAEGQDVALCYNGYPEFLNSVQVDKAERFTVCFHGVLGFFQDIEGLVDVARKLEGHDVEVLVIGYGRKEHLVRDQAPANLRFLGRLPLQETLSAVATAHVGICMRTDDRISKDAFPIKIFECLGVGIPVLVSPPCEGGAFVEDENCGKQFAVADRDGIVAEILRLQHDAVYYAAQVAAARRAAVHLSRANLGKDHAGLVYDVLKGLQ